MGPADATLSRGEQADVAIASDSDNEGESKRLLKVVNATGSANVMQHNRSFSNM